MEGEQEASEGSSAYLSSPPANFKMLGMKDVTACVMRPISAHLPGEDCVRIEDQEASGSAVELYFTYRGLLRCLFASRKPVARTFVAWAEEVLFAAHMGTEEQREELAAALVGHVPSPCSQQSRFRIDVCWLPIVLVGLHCRIPLCKAPNSTCSVSR